MNERTRVDFSWTTKNKRPVEKNISNLQPLRNDFCFQPLQVLTAKLNLDEWSESCAKIAQQERSNDNLKIALYKRGIFILCII